MMKKLVLFLVLFLGVTAFNKVCAQTETLLTITVYESIDKGYNRIVVVQDEKVAEEIELLPFNHKDLISHQIEINKLILKYRKSGFKLLSEIRGSISNGSGLAVMVTTYRLEL